MIKKVLIEVLGGVVQQVTVNDPKIEVYLLDYDDLAAEGLTAEQRDTASPRPIPAEYASDPEVFE